VLPEMSEPAFPTELNAGGVMIDSDVRSVDEQVSSHGWGTTSICGCFHSILN